MSNVLCNTYYLFWNFHYLQHSRCELGVSLKSYFKIERADGGNDWLVNFKGNYLFLTNIVTNIDIDIGTNIDIDIDIVINIDIVTNIVRNGSLWSL